MEIVFFVGRFKIGTRGLAFKIIVSFYVFVKIALFSEKFANPLFDGFNFKSFSTISKFKILKSKMIFWKSQKLRKVTNLCLHQPLGQMAYFKNEQNLWPKCGKVLFCVTFGNMSLWFRLQNKGVFFLFSKIALFC